MTYYGVAKINKINVEDNRRDDLYDLSEYIRYAKWGIKYFLHNDIEKRNKFLKNEDCISYITDRIIKAHCTWREDGGSSLKTHMINAIQYALKSWQGFEIKTSDENTQSLSQSITNDNSLNIFDTLEDTKTKTPFHQLYESEEAKNKQLRKDIEKLIGQVELTDREVRLIKMRYFEDMTYQAIANDLGCTKQHVHSLVQNAIKKIQNSVY